MVDLAGGRCACWGLKAARVSFGSLPEFCKARILCKFEIFQAAVMW